MAVYPGAVNGTTTNTVPPLPVALYPGDSTLLFNAEQPAAGQSSISVNLAGMPENHPGTVAIEGFWSGAPGNFSLQPQTSDTDADGMYQSEGAAFTQAAATVNTAANTFRLEITTIAAKFFRVNLVSRANAVNLTLRVTLK
jgi:hypothetical protein